MKEKSIAYLLWCGCLIGFCGLHRLYAGRIGSGLLWLFTLGLLGIGQFIDLFLIPEHIDVANFRRMPQAAPVMNQIVTINNPVTPIQQMQPASQQSNPLMELERLGGLLDKGYITREEFASGKQALLGYGEPAGVNLILPISTQTVDLGRCWHYAAANGLQFGPVSATEIGNLFRQQQISTRSLVWRDGMTQWEPLAHFASELGIAM